LQLPRKGKYLQNTDQKMLGFFLPQETCVWYLHIGAKAAPPVSFIT